MHRVCPEALQGAVGKADVTVEWHLLAELPEVPIQRRIPSGERPWGVYEGKCTWAELTGSDWNEGDSGQRSGSLGSPGQPPGKRCRVKAGTRPRLGISLHSHGGRGGAGGRAGSRSQKGYSAHCRLYKEGGVFSSALNEQGY